MYFLTEWQPLGTEITQQLKTTQFELERAIINVTGKVTNLVTLSLVGYLPISVLVILHSIASNRQNQEDNVYGADNKASLVLHTRHSL